MRGDLRQNYVSNCVLQNLQFLLLPIKFFSKDIGTEIAIEQEKLKNRKNLIHGRSFPRVAGGGRRVAGDGWRVDIWGNLTLESIKCSLLIRGKNTSTSCKTKVAY